MNILVLAAHTDDAEIGCGGFVSRALEEGHEVFVAAFSPCIESIPEDFTLDSTEREFERSMEYLSVTGSILFDYKVRNFPESRQSILDDIIALGKDFKPTHILTHNRQDPHQDHHCLVWESIRAFRNCSILSWETPRMSSLSRSQFFVPLSSKHLSDKIIALNCYDSQKVKPSWQLTGDGAVSSLAKVRGSACGCEYAEAYEVVKWIW